MFFSSFNVNCSIIESLPSLKQQNCINTMYLNMSNYPNVGFKRRLLIFRELPLNCVQHYVAVLLWLFTPLSIAFYLSTLILEIFLYCCLQSIILIPYQSIQKISSRACFKNIIYRHHLRR